MRIFESVLPIVGDPTESDEDTDTHRNHQERYDNEPQEDPQRPLFGTVVRIRGGVGRSDLVGHRRTGSLPRLLAVSKVGIDESIGFPEG
jgi:hypothetical protein